MEFNQGSKAAILNTAAELISLGINSQPASISSTMMVAFSALPKEELLIIAKRNVQILQELTLKYKNEETSEG